MKKSHSYLVYLECCDCLRRFDPGVLRTFCPDCHAPLLANYDLSSARQHLSPSKFLTRSPGMWRWRELLPVINLKNIVTLGEGDTPVLKMHHLEGELGLSNLFLKDESLNPTGTFKARGLSVAISKAKELGVKKVLIPSAGNAGGAMAAYAARAGLEAYIFMPRDTPLANVEESRITGANVTLIDGLIDEAARIGRKKAKFEGWFDLSTFREPYRVEGKKIMGYELAEFFNWKLPDVIIYPTGGGTGLVGMWKAFNELIQLGWLVEENRPRMVAVQAEGCAPIIKAIDEGKNNCDLWIDANTIASGLRVPISFADKLILRYIRDSNGTAVSVSDEEILEAQNKLAQKEGIFAAPEGAATLAGLTQLLENRWISPDETIVLFNTGTGLKYLK